MDSLILKISSMLFYLTDSLIVPSSDPDYTHIYKSICILAMQVESSQHLLTGDYDVIDHFRKVFQGNPIIGPLFNTIYQNYSTSGIPGYVTFYIEIVNSVPKPERIIGGKVVRQLYYSHFDKPDKASSSLLMGEDTNDAIFYEHILCWYIKEHAPFAHHKLRKCHGGGVNTAREIFSHLNQGDILIAIIDTDKKYPNCPIKRDSTYDKCRKLVRKEPHYCLLPIDVQEIENLVPRNYIDACNNWNNQLSYDSVCKSKIEMLYSDSENTLPFFDFKKGLVIDEDVRNIIGYKEFARKCYDARTDLKALESDFDVFLSSSSNGTEICPKLFGGSGLIKRIMQLLRSTECPQTPILFPFQKDNWEKIGQSMLNWCISRNNERLY